MEYLNSYTVFSGAFNLALRITNDTSKIDDGKCHIQGSWSFRFKACELTSLSLSLSNLFLLCCVSLCLRFWHLYVICHLNIFFLAISMATSTVWFTSVDQRDGSIFGFFNAHKKMSWWTMLLLIWLFIIFSLLDWITFDRSGPSSLGVRFIDIYWDFLFLIDIVNIFFQVWGKALSLSPGLSTFQSQ